MPGTSGFELTNQIYQHFPDAAIIYCTAYNHFVFDSYKLNAFYFVRKSFLQSDFYDALTKYLSSLAYQTNNYYIRSSSTAEKLPIDQILYFEVAHNDLYIHLLNGEERRERKPLKTVSMELPSGGFIRISQTFLVNKAYVVKIENNQAHLINGQKIDIPRVNIHRVLKEFLSG